MLFPNGSIPNNKGAQPITTPDTPINNGKCQDQLISKLITYCCLKFIIIILKKPYICQSLSQILYQKKTRQC